jgi:hypothetical protein
VPHPTTCTKCGQPTLRWSTVHKHVPVDVLQCTSCKEVIAEEDWIAPLMPIRQGRCTNCGDKVGGDRCMNCGLSPAESVQVHDELRAMISPNHNHLNAAREASRSGRRLLALKLATAAAAADEEGQGDLARALRIWLLLDIGEGPSALDEAKAWVEARSDPPAIAWASLGQQQEHAGIPGSAADSYAKALLKDPDQHGLRARRAEVLLNMSREGQAVEEACKVFESTSEDRSIVAALRVAEKLLEKYHAAHRDDEIRLLLERAGVHAERSALLLGHRARLAAVEGRVADARRDVKKARRLAPDLQVYAEIDEALRPQKTSWWRW